MRRKAACFLVLAACSGTVPAAPEPATSAAQRLACRAPTSQADGNSPTGRYTVGMKSWDKRVVRIGANVRTLGDALMMYPEGAGHVPDGWATYIRNLAATDAKGNPVALERVGAGAWRVPDRLKGQEIALKYEVLLHHDAGETWPFGWDEAAYVKGGAAFFTGKALFITALDMQNITVDFDLPDGWKLVTPWEAECRERSYRVKDAIELTESAHFTGDFIHREVAAAGATVEIGLGKALTASAPLVEEVLKRSLHTAAHMLGPVPDQTFAVIADLEPQYTGGGTFVRSVSMLFQEPPTSANKAEWGHTVTHELLHLWLGGAIKPAARQEYWLTEGFTDYLANLVGLRSGLITEQTFWQRVRDHHTKYVKQAGRASLRDAGNDKAAHYDLVYSGGFLAALTLDVQMRERSGHARGVPDLVQALNDQYGGRTGFTPHDVGRIAGRLSGGDHSAYIRDYVLGMNRLPMERVLGSLGVPLAAEAGARGADNRKAARLRERLLFGDGPGTRPQH